MKTITIIEKNLWADHFIVRCDCFCEFIEFSVFDKEDVYYCYIEYFGNNYKPKNISTSFVFDKISFNDFIEGLRNILYTELRELSINDVSKDRKDKCRTYNLKLCKNYYGNDFCDVSILLFKNKKHANKLKKCIWEIVLDVERVKELVERLEIMKRETGI